MAVEFAPDDYRKYELDWDHARLYCFSLNIDGKIGWRLPTIDELAAEDWGLCDEDLSMWVWTSDSVESRYLNSSSTLKDPHQYAYQYVLCDGELYAMSKKISEESWVFPVRDL